MAASPEPVPPGPAEEFSPDDDLLDWMTVQFGRFGDIFKARAYGTDIFAIRDPELAYRVLVTNWTNYVKGQFIKRVAILLGNGIMVSEGELWKRQRRMVHPAFHRNSVGALVDMISSVNSALLARWQLAARRGESVNVTRDVSAMALEVVLRSILGDDYDRHGPKFSLLSEEPGRNLGFAKDFRALGKVILEIAHERRARAVSTTDLIGVLLAARDPKSGEPMPDGRIVNEVLTMIVAGHETTASTLSWTWYLISQHPEVEQALGREALTAPNRLAIAELASYPYSRQVIDESMRLYPAGWLLTRKAIKDDQLGAYRVPAGSEIYVAPYFIHRNPAHWPAPERFDPTRFEVQAGRQRHRLALIPFAAGPRNCIGELFAAVEMQIHLLMVARTLRLEYRQVAPPELDAGVNLRSKIDFIMYPALRTPENS